MVVAVVTVRMVKASVDEIADMVAMGYGLMPAAGPMNVPRLMPVAHEIRRAGVRIAIAHFNFVLVDMVAENVVKVTIVDVVNVIAMPDRSMTAARAVLMRVILVLRVRAIAHRGLQNVAIQHCKPSRRNSIPKDRSRSVPANRFRLTTYFLP